MWNNSAVASTIIRAHGVQKRFGSNRVLDGASFEISEGVTGLLGANGAGKTTLLGLMLGLDTRDGGDLQVLGKDPEREGNEIRARIGYSPEHHRLPPELPAADFVQHIATVHGLPPREATGRASDAMWYVGLGEERNRPIGSLSTGQRQRVKLAMAIAHDPVLVMLDEPTDGLDPTQRENMLGLIRQLSHEFGINVLLVSHLLDEVERTCEQVVILKDGRVTAAGGLDEIRGVGRGIRVEVVNNSDALAAYLEERGCVVERSGAKLIVAPSTSSSYSEEELLGLAADGVIQLGCGLRSLENQTVSLEEVFMAVGV